MNSEINVRTLCLRRYLVPCPCQNAFQTKKFACCIIEVDRKIKYIIIFVSLYLVVFIPVFISFSGVEWWVLILPMSFCVQLESRQPKVYVKKKKINTNHFAVPNRVKNGTNFVQEKWLLTGGGDRYLRKSLTLSWTRKLSESKSSSVLSV